VGTITPPARSPLDVIGEAARRALGEGRLGGASVGYDGIKPIRDGLRVVTFGVLLGRERAQVGGRYAQS
jgi:hypothetical protein